MVQSEIVRRYEQSASLVRTHGILSIVFGAIGTFFGLIMIVLFSLALSDTYDRADAIGFIILFLMTLVFWVLPHIYLLVAGITLVKLPEPRIVKTLSIINIVISVFGNYILLVFAIISLVQANDYENGYSLTKK
jgi:hypothetical protein